MSKSAKFIIFILFILVLASLALNGLIIWQLLMVQQRIQNVAAEAGPTIQESLDEIIIDLEKLEGAALEFDIAVDQDFPVDTEIAFSDTVEVPIQMTVPISQTIETTVFLELVGGVELPVDIAVPVNVEVPIDNTVVIPIERTIPISVTVPLKEDFLIEIDVAESDLALQIARLREGLISLNAFIDQALAEVQ